MKSYQNTLDGVKEEIATLKKHLKILREHPPTKIYLLYGDHVIIPHRYVVCLETWRNKILFNVIASNDWDLSCMHSMLLGEFLSPRRTELVPIKIKDLPLYIHFKHKSTLFEKIIKTGKIPRR